MTQKQKHVTHLQSTAVKPHCTQSIPAPAFKSQLSPLAVQVEGSKCNRVKPCPGCAGASSTHLAVMHICVGHVLCVHVPDLRGPVQAAGHGKPASAGEHHTRHVLAVACQHLQAGTTASGSQAGGPQSSSNTKSADGSIKPWLFGVKVWGDRINEPGDMLDFMHVWRRGWMATATGCSLQRATEPHALCAAKVRQQLASICSPACVPQSGCAIPTGRHCPAAIACDRHIIDPACVALQDAAAINTHDTKHRHDDKVMGVNPSNYGMLLMKQPTSAGFSSRPGDATDSSYLHPTMVPQPSLYLHPRGASMCCTNSASAYVMSL